MKPNLLLLHGWGINSRIWDGVLPSLRESFEVFPIDLPGYGSLADQQPGDDLQEIAATVLRQAPESAIWCGWSLGGMVAMAAALQEPKRIDRLSLVCSTPRFMQGDQWEHGSNDTVMQNLSAQFEKNYSKALAMFFLLQLGTAPDARTRARELAGDVLQECAPSWESLQQGLNLLRRTDIRQSVTHISCPTDVIVGTEDRVIPAGAGRFLANSIPDAQLHEIDAGHVPFITSSGWFIDRMKKFAGAKC